MNTHRPFLILSPLKVLSLTYGLLLAVPSILASDSDLQILGIKPSFGGMKIEWSAGTQVWQLLEFREKLSSDSDPWVIRYANPPGSQSHNYFIDLAVMKQSGFYRVRETADPGLLWSVSAGPDLTVTLPAQAELSGTVTNQELANGPLTVAWNILRGEGSVTFGDARAIETTALFSAAGTYILRLTVSDNKLSVSKDVTVTAVGNPFKPAITIEHPVSCQAYLLPSPVSIAADVTGNTGQVAQVEFFVNRSSIGTDNTYPFGIIWTNATKGTHQLKARAYSQTGAIADSPTITIDVYDVTNLPYRITSKGGPTGLCCLSVGAARNPKVEYCAIPSSGEGRGFNTLVVRPGILRDDLTEKRTFDTWASRNQGTQHAELESYLDSIPDDSVLLIAVADEAGVNDFESCKRLPYPWVSALVSRLTQLRSSMIRDYCYRDAWGMIVLKGTQVVRGEGLGHGTMVDSATATNWTDATPHTGSRLVYAKIGSYSTDYSYEPLDGGVIFGEGWIVAGRFLPDTSHPSQDIYYGLYTVDGGIHHRRVYLHDDHPLERTLYRTKGWLTSDGFITDMSQPSRNISWGLFMTYPGVIERVYSYQDISPLDRAIYRCKGWITEDGFVPDLTQPPRMIYWLMYEYQESSWERMYAYEDAGPNAPRYDIPRCKGWIIQDGFITDLTQPSGYIYWGEAEIWRTTYQLVYNHYDWEFLSSVCLGKGWLVGETFVPDYVQPAWDVYYGRHRFLPFENELVLTYSVNPGLEDEQHLGKGWIGPEGFIPE